MASQWLRWVRWIGRWGAVRLRFPEEPMGKHHGKNPPRNNKKLKEKQNGGKKPKVFGGGFSVRSNIWFLGFWWVLLSAGPVVFFPGTPQAGPFGRKIDPPGCFIGH